MVRRAQSVILTFALLAAPPAFAARGFACGARECAMMCCARHHAEMKHCAGEANAMPCAVRCRSQAVPDYGLAAPLAPFQLSTGATLPAMQNARTRPSAMNILDSAGHFPPPFEPPRS